MKKTIKLPSGMKIESKFGIKRVNKIKVENNEI